MEYYNSDGSAAAFCGNGARCVARFAALNGWIENRGSIHAAVGEVDCRVLEGGRIAIHMPDAPLPVYVDSEGGYFINTGVPHLVKEVAFSSDGEFTLWAGQRAVPSRQFPEGVNVDAYCQEGSRLRVRTYERGVNAETLSCGTGVVATALTAAYVGALAEGSMSIFTRGGKLGVDFTRSGEQPGFQNVWLSGPAERIAEGVFYYNE